MRLANHTIREAWKTVHSEKLLIFLRKSEKLEFSNDQLYDFNGPM